MKKTKWLSLILGISVMLTACSNSSGGGSGSGNDGGDDSSLISYTFPEDNYYYTIPDDCQKLNIPASYIGKNCFIIYSNLTQGNIDKSKDLVKNEDFTDERTAFSEVTGTMIFKHALTFADGTYRDEIQFAPNPFQRKKNYSRTATENEEPPELPKPFYREEDNAEFWINTNNGEFSKKTFTKKYDGVHCRIWYYNNNPGVVNDSVFTDIEINKLASTINKAFQIETAIFGSNAFDGGVDSIDANENTKLDVLIYDLLGDASDTQNGGIFGFFRPYDFNANKFIEWYDTKYNKDYPANSNECEVIHIDAYFLQKDILGYENTKEDGSKENVQTHKVESTLIHEFQHLLNYCNKYGNYNTWFTEMLAMSAEEVLQKTINTSDDDSPKSRFNFQFNRPYQGFINWPENSSDNVYYAYSNAYAFGAYLMRNFGGTKLIHEIATNKKENGEPYRDGESITQALHTCGFTNESFETVLQKFGMTYVFSTVFDTKKISLSNYLVETFKNSDNAYGYVIALDSIYLNNYLFPLYNTKAEMENDANNNLYFNKGEYKYVYWDSGEHAIYGPRIFKPNYKLPEPIQPSGFAVYHAGAITTCGKAFRVNKSSGITMTAVIK